MLERLKAIDDCLTEVRGFRKMFLKAHEGSKSKPNSGDYVDGSHAQKLNASLEQWRRLFDGEQFRLAQYHAIQLTSINHKTTNYWISDSLARLLDPLREDISKRRAYVIREEDDSLFDVGLRPALAFAFPSANREMVEARNCFALGRHTACVFHLMRR
jgi:hypothetical protein